MYTNDISFSYQGYKIIGKVSKTDVAFQLIFNDAFIDILTLPCFKAVPLPLGFGTITVIVASKDFSVPFVPLLLLSNVVVEGDKPTKMA